MNILPSMFVVISMLFVSTQASAGDRSWTFVECFRGCKSANCTTEDQLAEFAMRQPAMLQYLGWDCLSECQHVCMWKAVDDFRKDGIPQQQYYGKWPFVRIFGVQEPASTVFSVLNGLSHAAMLIFFRRRVPSTAPMYYVTHLYSLVNINAWIWSTVFHVRDTNFTEKMDYFSAILLVMISLFAACVRLSLPRYHRLVGGITGVILLSYYVYHVHYLAFVHFDYGYNMMANITIGVINAAVWLSWCYRVRKRQPYVWKAAWTIITLSLLVLLELLDFVPFFWTIDAHSLWHLGTIPLPLLWYRFLVDDCNYLTKSESTSSEQLVDIKSASTKKKI